MSAQVKFRQEPGLAEGLRSRKKVQTRRSIEDAALALFAEHGYDATTVEQISDQAEVSTATFFRYFPSKADVVLCQQGEQIPLLQQTIIERPAGEGDIDVVRIAFHEVWVPAIDPERTMRAGQAINSSPLLRGLYGDISRNWLTAVAEALARRRGLNDSDPRSKVAARVALAVFGGAVENWMMGGCVESLSEVIDRDFATVETLYAGPVGAGA
jgi:AcrR family transcriptional regulator